jgi:ArsR family transcriptional regulator
MLTKPIQKPKMIFKRMNMMAKHKDSYDSQVKLFKALMHPGRLAILNVLRTGEACVCHMEAALGFRQAYLSQQLMVLREAGLVDDQRDGWNVYYRVSKPEVFSVIDAARATLGDHTGTAVPAVIASCACPHCTGEKPNVVATVAKAA